LNVKEVSFLSVAFLEVVLQKSQKESSQILHQAKKNFPTHIACSMSMSSSVATGSDSVAAPEKSTGSDSVADPEKSKPSSSSSTERQKSKVSSSTSSGGRGSDSNSNLYDYSYHYLDGTTNNFNRQCTFESNSQFDEFEKDDESFHENNNSSGDELDSDFELDPDLEIAPPKMATRVPASLRSPVAETPRKKIRTTPPGTTALSDALAVHAATYDDAPGAGPPVYVSAVQENHPFIRGMTLEQAGQRFVSLVHDLCNNTDYPDEAQENDLLPNLAQTRNKQITGGIACGLMMMTVGSNCNKPPSWVFDDMSKIVDADTEHRRSQQIADVINKLSKPVLDYVQHTILRQRKNQHIKIASIMTTNVENFRKNLKDKKKRASFPVWTRAFVDEKGVSGDQSLLGQGFYLPLALVLDRVVPGLKNVIDVSSDLELKGDNEDVNAAWAQVVGNRWCRTMRKRR